MRYTFAHVFLYLMLLSGKAFSQGGEQAETTKAKPRPPGQPIYADCDSPVLIKVFKRQSYGPTVPPAGYGKLQEIRAKEHNSNLAFEQEHHTAWYLLKMYFDGEVVFDIVPDDSTNDYDFLLFPYKDSTFCGQLKANTLKPVRSNIRRNDILTKGVTGLSSDAPNELQAQGPGAQYSKSIFVKKGEQYMLVLDNVYPGGQGHTLHFFYRKEIEIQGTVTDEDGKAIAHADVVLSAASGETVAETQSDDSGKYRMEVKVNEYTDYHLNVSAYHHFFDETIINTRTHSDSMLVSLKSVLPELKKGRNFKLKGINFYGGSPQPLPEAYAPMRQLYKLMKQNPTLNILIEGHINNPLQKPDAGRKTPREIAAGENREHKEPHRDSEDEQKLSEWRALAVYRYLQEKGIDTSRIDQIGMGSQKMLFPYAKSEREQSVNRRVEIKVISL